MNSMAVGGYINADATNPRRGHWEPFVIIASIPYHKYGHYVRSNRVALKYLDFKKDVDPNVHVIVFNSIVKTNVETFEKYIINAFSYMLRDMTSNWCHNYMSEFLDYIVLELTHTFYKRHQKIQNDEQIFVELKNMKQEKIRGWRFTMNRFKSWLMVYKYY
jgi:hypothetical protein